MLCSKFIESNESIIDLEKNYTHIRAYHGCSTKNVENYYKYGILPINKNFAKKQALELLIDDGTSSETVLRVFNEHWKEFDIVHRSVWFSLLRQELIKYSGHYLIYGSEFITNMAAELCCLDKLKEKGQPTIFHCDVPIQQIPAYFFDSIKEKLKIGDIKNCGFKIEDNLSPEEIVKHDTPKLVYDPLNGLRTCYYS